MNNHTSCDITNYLNFITSRIENQIIFPNKLEKIDDISILTTNNFKNLLAVNYTIQQLKNFAKKLKTRFPKILSFGMFFIFSILMIFYS